MWICSNTGFMSIVQPKPFDFTRAKREKAVPADAQLGDYLSIRARKAKELKGMFPGFKVVLWKGRDYPARVFVTRKELAERMAAAVAAIGYTNFKDSVKDHPLHDAYMAVWSVMNGYGNGRYDRKPGGGRQSSFDYETPIGRLPHWSALEDEDTLDPYGNTGGVDDNPADALDYVPRSSYGMDGR